MKLVRALFEKLGWRKMKLRGQMYLLYTVGLIIPLIVVGVVLLCSAKNMLNDYYMELLQTDNLRVKSILSQMTKQVYNISDEICFDDAQKEILSATYETPVKFVEAVNENNELDSLMYDYQAVEGVYIYTDNPTVANYKQYNEVTDEIRNTDWYKRSTTYTNAFWTYIEEDNAYKRTSNISLVRRILLPNSEYKAVIVIKLGDAYIRSLIDSDIIDAISLDGRGVVYSSKRNWYGKKLPLEINYDNPYYSDSDIVEIENKHYFSSVSTMNMYMTNSRLRICTLNGEIYSDINKIMSVCVLILCLAILIPGVILFWFTNRFTGRLYMLREEMHKASNQDYNISTYFNGHDELTEAFNDLKTMVSNIKEKDAMMYENELREKEMLNNQHIIEYKMLASQINPHYLYNTLETIRMKSLTSGNKEVADCIKIFGKTLQYVLKNTGTTATSLKKEIEHVTNYLAIQKLRFQDRINYSLKISEDLEPEEYEVLPLLLQPIVENAVIHGLESVDSEGYIEIFIEQNDKEKLIIYISDNGVGMGNEELEAVREKLKTPGLKPESSIGVYNICERIRLHYGDEYGLHIESELGKGTRVTLILPVINTK